MKYFSWKDKSGRGDTTKNIPLSRILEYEEDEEGYDYQTLHEWAKDAQPGDTWESHDQKFTCTHEKLNQLGKTTMTITANNYFAEADKFISKLPGPAKEAHELVLSLKNDGIENPFNTGDADIDEVGAKLLEQANKVLNDANEKPIKRDTAILKKYAFDERHPLLILEKDSPQWNKAYDEFAAYVKSNPQGKSGEYELIKTKPGAKKVGKSTKYSIYDDGNELVKSHLTEAQIIDWANTAFYYDQQDNDAEPFTSIDEVKRAFKAEGYQLFPAGKKPKTPRKKVASKKRVAKPAKSAKSKNMPVKKAKRMVRKVAAKAVKQARKSDVKKAPVTIKKLSLELQIIKQVAGMAGKTYTVAAVEKKRTTIGNHLKEGRIHDHVTLIKQLHTGLGKMIDAATKAGAGNIKASFSRGKKEELLNLVKDAKVRVRTEFLAGEPEYDSNDRFARKLSNDYYTEFTDPGYIVREDGMYFVPEDQRATSTKGKWSNTLTHRSHMDWHRASKVARYLSMQKGNEKHTFTVKEFHSKKV